MEILILFVIAAALVSYLLGSLNFAIIVTRLLYGKDIHAYGSGNAGMTNVLRSFGKGAAVLTIIGDIGKGVLAVSLSKWLFSVFLGYYVPGVAYISCICAVLGHLFPIYFKFKGGKGVSVAAGAIIAIEPVLFLPLLLVFVLVILFTKIVSLASIICAVCYPLFTLAYCLLTQRASNETALVTALALLPAALVIYMHRENIKRLRAGTEYKFGQKK